MCEGTVLMLVGNKLDLADSHSREVTTAEGQNLAEVKFICIFKDLSAVIHSKPINKIMIIITNNTFFFLACTAVPGFVL